MLRRVVQVIIAVMIGVSVFIWAEQAAYKQRGYQAYGGEYILAVIAGVVSYCVAGKV